MKKMEFLKTGIEGLDNILHGGLPRNRIYLLEGDPGSGKTTLALQFLLEGVSKGEKCLYISLSESLDELRHTSAAHGWNIEKVHFLEMPFESQLLADDQNSFFHTSELELGETNKMILEEIKRIKPDRIVIDSLTELKLMSQNSIRFRRQVLAYKQLFSEQNITALLLDDKTSIDDQEVQSIVNGIIILQQLAPEYGAERRRLRVAKLRAVAYRGGFHDFVIATGGLKVFPRLISAEHSTKKTGELMSSGVKGIDAMVGGGPEKGSSTLVMGPAGAGKSSLVLQYATEAAKRGEKAAVFSFDESVHTILSRTKGLGCELESYVEQGLVYIHKVDPAQLSPGEFSNLVRHAVEKDKVQIVVIDSLNGYLSAMPEERFLIIQMHELLSYLSLMGVSTFLVVVQHGLLGTNMETAIDISYLADNVFLLRYFESYGEVRQALSVVKRRAGRHERTIREFKMSEQGLQVGEPLSIFQGILSGTPRVVDDKSQVIN